MTQKTTLHLYKYRIFTKFYTQFPTPLDTEKKEKKQKKSKRSIIGTCAIHIPFSNLVKPLYIPFNTTMQYKFIDQQTQIEQFDFAKKIQRERELGRRGRRWKGKQKLSGFTCRCQENIAISVICYHCFLSFLCFFYYH